MVSLTQALTASTDTGCDQSSLVVASLARASATSLPWLGIPCIVTAVETFCATCTATAKRCSFNISISILVIRKMFQSVVNEDSRFLCKVGNSVATIFLKNLIQICFFFK